MPHIERKHKSRAYGRAFSARVAEEAGYQIERHGDQAIAKIDETLSSPGLSDDQQKFLYAVKRRLAGSKVLESISWPSPIARLISHLGVQKRSATRKRLE